MSVSIASVHVLVMLPWRPHTFHTSHCVRVSPADFFLNWDPVFDDVLHWPILHRISNGIFRMQKVCSSFV